MNNSIVRIGLAAAAVVILAVIGINLIGPKVGAPPAATPSPSPTPTVIAAAQLSGQASLTAGRYQVDPNLPVDVTVEVPEGWSAGGNWVVIGPNGNGAPAGMAIRFYTASNLYLNPLSPDDGVLDPQVGPSSEDFAIAMVDHPDWTTTGPDAFTIDGFAGQVVHVILPPGTSEATPFYLSVDTGGGQAFGWAAGQLFDIYVVEVGGQRLVIDAFHYPDTSAADLAAQQVVLSSIQLASNP